MSGIVFTFLPISLIYVLIEDSWTLVSASAFNLSQYVVLVEKYEENLFSNRYLARKEKSIWTAFWGDCGSISCFDITPKQFYETSG